jgi:glycosyltransferase involved in cell wall biosynthesis
MKIAFIGQKNLQAKIGGVEKNVEDIAVHLAKKGHVVFAYVQNKNGAKKFQNYKGVRIIIVPSLGIKFLDNFIYIIFASFHALFAGYDIVHLNVNKQKISDAILKIFKTFKKAVATFSVPDGISLNHSKKINHLTRLELKDQKYILAVGTLTKESGAHYLIEAFKQLEDTSRTSNNFKLVLVGNNLQDDEYVHFLQTISAERKNIIFAGEKKGEALEQLYSHAYLFVSPCETVVSTNALLEAMGHGLATLVSDVKENLEIIDGSGFSFVSKSVIDLRSRLAFLLSRPDEVKKNGELAKKRIKREFSWDSIVEKTTSIYKSIIK